MKAKFYSISLILFVLTIFISPAKAQVTGTVFRDYNANGAKDNYSSFNENGVKVVL